MQGIFQKENTDKALKYGIYRHLPTYEKIIRNLVSFYFTIPIKKWYTAVGGKRYLHAAVSFFAENDKNQKSNGGELHG